MDKNLYCPPQDLSRPKLLFHLESNPEPLQHDLHKIITRRGGFEIQKLVGSLLDWYG